MSSTTKQKMITPPKGYLLSDKDDAELVETMREFGRYLVGLCFLARRHEIDGDPEKQIKPNFCSGFIMEFQAKWYWITAGHILQAIVELQNDPMVILENFRLIDHYGTRVVDKNCIPFHFDGAWKYFECDDILGLDYGAVELGRIERLAMEKNNVRPLPMNEYRQLEGKEFTYFFMLGLPEDSIERALRRNTDGFTATAKSNPCIIHIEQLRGDPGEKHRRQLPRFVGKLGPSWPEGEVAGMSGGPVFGLNETTGEYGVVAVQSGWFRPDRITFACPIAVFCPRLLNEISKR